MWTNAAVNGYADDTSCTTAGDTIQSIKENTEEEAQKILTFLSVNFLAANPGKTAILVVRSEGAKDAEKISFSIGDKTITESKVTKGTLLGIKLTNDLEWKEHVKILNKELGYRLFALMRLSNVLPKYLLKTVANAIFVSKIRYCLALFCPLRLREDEPVNSLMSRVRITYNKVLRLLTGTTLRKKMSVKNMLKKLEWPSLNQLCAETRLLEAWKIANDPNSPLCGIMKLRETTSNMKTRSQRHKVMVPGRQTKLSKTSFVYPTAKIWNNAPSSIKEAKKVRNGKALIRAFAKTLPL